MTGNILFTQTFSLAGHTFFHHLPGMHYERHTQGAVCGFGDYGITVRMFRSLHMIIAHVTGCATALFAVAVRALRIFLNVEGFQRKFFAAASAEGSFGYQFLFHNKNFYQL
ncbi:conserved domain protein [Bacteroides fluxus YIT 12057]|uniref:Conserved domain protein n=1 Tax=Bacteroides fluxus YIT 12057 TaxID=763034 RepID=F3PV06_9BACE|nr:conserved domain protein [Bacteroides fluxus YIT 12057]